MIASVLARKITVEKERLEQRLRELGLSEVGTSNASETSTPLSEGASQVSKSRPTNGDVGRPREATPLDQRTA
jgi:hypothetical protein